MPLFRSKARCDKETDIDHRTWLILHLLEIANLLLDEYALTPDPETGRTLKETTFQDLACFLLVPPSNWTVVVSADNLQACCKLQIRGVILLHPQNFLRPCWGALSQKRSIICAPYSTQLFFPYGLEPAGGNTKVRVQTFGTSD